MSRTTILTAWFVTVLSACLVGCNSGSRLYPVSGTVEYQGKPVKFGTISFRAEDGSTGAAQVVDGAYRLSAEGGLKPGAYRVAINYPDPRFPRPSGNEPPGEAVPIREVLPARYNNATELTADIKADENRDLNFQLK